GTRADACRERAETSTPRCARSASARFRAVRARTRGARSRTRGAPAWPRGNRWREPAAPAAARTRPDAAGAARRSRLPRSFEGASCTPLPPDQPVAQPLGRHVDDHDGGDDQDEDGGNVGVVELADGDHEIIADAAGADETH